MKPSAYITALLPKLKECFEKHPVDKVWLFGSYSRGEETVHSDVDFLVKYTNDDNLSLLSVSRLYRALKNILEKEVDVIEEGYLLPFAQASCENDKILIYERKAKR